jgi:hypothetical protein
MCIWVVDCGWRRRRLIDDELASTLPEAWTDRSGAGGAWVQECLVRLLKRYLQSEVEQAGRQARSE